MGLLAKSVEINPPVAECIIELTQECTFMSSVVKKRRKKMRKHKHKKLRRRMKFAKRRN